MSMPKIHVRTGDRVLVIAGKDKGKKGQVLKAMPRENRVVVEGINMVKKHRKPTREMMQGGIVEQPAPMNASNVQLICKGCGKATRVGKRVLADGRKVRYCKECDENIDR